MSHTELAKGDDVPGDVRIAAGKQLALAIVEDRCLGIFVPGRPVGYCNALRIAIGPFRVGTQTFDAASEAFKGVEQELRVCTDRIPSIAERNHAPQRGGTFAADPDRRMGFL